MTQVGTAAPLFWHFRLPTVAHGQITLFNYQFYASQTSDYSLPS
jgi:hypothetical protein